MNPTQGQRGTTLLEAVIARAVLMVGALGMSSLYAMSERMEADSRRTTRGTAIAQDLVNQIDLWPYADSRLSNDKPDNDSAIGDPGFAFESSADPVASKIADHGEDDLTKGGAAWNGLPAADIAGYERYWNVAYTDDSNGNGTADAVRIGVIVRWPSGSGWRRIVLTALKPNPAEAR